MADVHAVLLAGGKGSRFWPLSRQAKGKQFLSMLGDEPLLKQSIDRVSDLVKPDHYWIVGSHAHEQILEEFTSLVPKANMLLEPKGRNTGPSIAWAAQAIEQVDPDAIILVLPADHWVDDAARFCETLDVAVKEATQYPHIVTIGITPTFPHTGYGYIQVQDQTGPIKSVNAFVEKPSLEQADMYLKKGTYFWNAGIFVASVQTLSGLYRQFQPEIWSLMHQIIKSTSLGQVPELALFSDLESISFDYAIMELAVSKTRLVPANFKWGDIGSWSALAEFLPQDAANNACYGDVHALDSTGNLVYSPQKMVALVDVDEMIVVDSPDAILVAPKSSDQKIKTLYEQLNPDYQ